MQLIKFSLNLDKVQLEIENQHVTIDQGLSLIELKSIKHPMLDALALKNMIELIEEKPEHIKLDDKVQKVAHTSDPYFRQLSTLLFNGETIINRVKLEHALNEFIEHIEYYVEKAESDLKPFAYFIFLREMMHYLNVVEVRFGN